MPHQFEKECEDIQTRIAESRFRIDCKHILEQLVKRFKNISDPIAIVNRVMTSLIENTPADWRFTESPTSRFFIVEEETNAKFMGMSFRQSERAAEIIQFIQDNQESTERIWQRIDEFSKTYQEEVRRSDLPIVCYIRTVYPTGKGGTIGEEKRIFEKMREELSHVVSIAARKIASRPNAVVTVEKDLWARQYMNWLSVEPGTKEYYLFQPLTKAGILKSRFRIFSYTENGTLKRVGDNDVECDELCGNLDEIKGEINLQASIRSESYWKVPTNLDQRWIDLDYRKRYSKKHAMENIKKIDEEEKLPFVTSSEIAELYFLNKILNKAKTKLHRK